MIPEKTIEPIALKKATKHVVSILSVKHVTPDVLRFVTERPPDYIFKSGQATEISINKDKWRNKKRPFTFTSLPENEHLEFTIKTYPSHAGVTNELLTLNVGSELILHEVFGTILYEGEGVFIAGGAGVTPFISIFRYLASQNKTGGNKLILANKTKADIINEEEFKTQLGENFINVLSAENKEGYEHGYITTALLKKYIPDNRSKIYLCGPPPMMDAIEKELAEMHIPTTSIIKEQF